MRGNWDKALCKDFPKLYAQRGLSPRETCMCWGFSCGDGWEPIIRRLSAKLEAAGAVAVQVKEKFGTLRFYIEGIAQPTPLRTRLHRIWLHLTGRGTWLWTWWKPWQLWWILDYPPAWDWIQEAKTESAKTCERCGEPGTLCGGPWLYTFCESCDLKHRTERSR